MDKATRFLLPVNGKDILFLFTGRDDIEKEKEHKNMLISDIYDHLQENCYYMKKMRAEQEKIMEGMLRREKENMSMQDYESLWDLLFQTELNAEKAGFTAGFRYAVALMRECALTESEDFNNL